MGYNFMLARGPDIPRITEGDLRLLRIFREVAEAGGLTAAEPALRMERSTISRHLQNLEAKLGGPLCLRGPAGFELTDLGQVALRAAVTACDTLNQVRDDLNRARNLVTGELDLGLADNCLTNPEARIVGALARFRQQAPAVRLKVTIRPPVDLVSDVLNRRLHLAIVGRPVGNDKLASQPLFKEEFRLYVRAEAPADADISALLALGYILVTRDSDPQSLSLASSLGIDRRAVASGLEAVATLIATGDCFGYLPMHMARGLSHMYRLRPVQMQSDPSYATEFSLVSEHARPLARAGELLSDLLVTAHSSSDRLQ
jgi:DNA-binding transcriptional LysR family regulator